jgi:hypothetical protein
MPPRYERLGLRGRRNPHGRATAPDVGWTRTCARLDLGGSVAKKKYDPLWKILDENVALQGAQPDVDARCPYCHVIVHVGLKGKVGERYECGLCGGVSLLVEEEEKPALESQGAQLDKDGTSIYLGWLRCLECRVVWQQGDRSQPYVPCPTCGAPGQARTIWPSISAQSLLSSVLEHELSDQESRVAAIVATTTFLETLLDDALGNLLEREGASYELRARLVGEVEAVDGRLSIVEQLLGTEVGDIAAELDAGWFMDEWKQYRRMRRNAGHQGNLYTFPADLRKDLERITVTGVKVFAEVNNRIWMAARGSNLGRSWVFLQALDD